MLDQDCAIEVGLDSLMKVVTGYGNGLQGADVCGKSLFVISIIGDEKLEYVPENLIWQDLCRLVDDEVCCRCLLRFVGAPKVEREAK
jgi:hypothetical protein